MRINNGILHYNTFTKHSSSLSTYRFGEALRIILDELDARNFYAINPAFPADFSK